MRITRLQHARRLAMGDSACAPRRVASAPSPIEIFTTVALMFS